MKGKLIIASAVAALFTSTAWAQMGPGMMGAVGPGGSGRGPGMMGGYGPGGSGMGPGMMGGYGRGGFGGLELSEEQRAKIAEIQQDITRKQWDLMRKMHDQGYSMHQFGATGSVDESAARKAYQDMADARKAMFEATLDARKRMEAVLTKEQREQLRGESHCG